MSRSSIRKKMMAEEYWNGQLYGVLYMFFALAAVVILIFNITLLKVFFFGWLVSYAILCLAGFPFERGITMKTIRRLLGLNIISMKLEALANFLKVRFTHVPEHYECEKEK